MKFFFFSFYLTARRQNTITIMLIALIFQKESIIITSQLWLTSPISTVWKIQNFSGHRGYRKSPLLLSFLYLHLPDKSRVTWETPSSEAVPSVRSHLGVRASYATRRKRRYEANKCGWTQPLFRKARDHGINKQSKPKGLRQY